MNEVRPMPVIDAAIKIHGEELVQALRETTISADVLSDVLWHKGTRLSATTIKLWRRRNLQRNG